MAKLLTITVKETAEELTKLLPACTSATKPRIKMLLAIRNGTTSTQELVFKTKSNRDSIRNWKNTYQAGGLQGLLKDSRGGNRPALINAAQKAKLQEKLSNPKGGFTSYKQAVAWIEKNLGLEMNYHTVNKYLKRTFKTKLKVGRKTHVNKDPAAEAVFKKTT